MADSRQRLIQLTDALLVVAREAANETDSLGRLLAQIHLLDTDMVEEVMDHLNEHGYSVLARRLERHIGRLRQKADEVFHETIPDDRKQEQRYLGALHSQARRLRDFLYELRSLVEEDDDAVRTDTDVVAKTACAVDQPDNGGETAKEQDGYVDKYELDAVVGKFVSFKRIQNLYSPKADKTGRNGRSLFLYSTIRLVYLQHDSSLNDIMPATFSEFSTTLRGVQSGQ